MLWRSPCRSPTHARLVLTAIVPLATPSEPLEAHLAAAASATRCGPPERIHMARNCPLSLSMPLLWIAALSMLTRNGALALLVTRTGTAMNSTLTCSPQIILSLASAITHLCNFVPSSVQKQSGRRCGSSVAMFGTRARVAHPSVRRIHVHQGISQDLHQVHHLGLCLLRCRYRAHRLVHHLNAIAAGPKVGPIAVRMMAATAGTIAVAVDLLRHLHQVPLQHPLQHQRRVVRLSSTAPIQQPISKKKWKCLLAAMCSGRRAGGR